MEEVNGCGWGMIACKVGLVAAGSLFGPWGTFGGMVAGNILCISHSAY